MATKTVNYTDEQTSAIVEGFKAGETVDVLATKVGRSVRSVIAKLSREGVYKAKDKTTEHADRVTKEDLVLTLAEITQVSFEKLESLSKASKGALEALVEFAKAADAVSKADLS